MLAPTMEAGRDVQVRHGPADEQGEDGRVHGKRIGDTVAQSFIISNCNLEILNYLQYLIQLKIH